MMYGFKVSKKKTVETVAHDALDIWAAAVYAQRVNGSYIKEDLWSLNPDTHEVEHDPHTLANRTVARNALQDGSITLADRTKGAEARKFISSRLMVKAISRTLTSFEESLSQAVALDEFIVPQDKMYIGIVNSQIASYDRMKKEESLTQDFVYGTYGDVGERLAIKVTPVSRFWLTDWGTYRYNSITENNYKTSFYYKEELEIGVAVKVRGTVKKHTTDTTTINRVKVI
tara:strand:- start:1553 stop:2239 length:687 start_codon:yes stop_codon:yes gene_type:complete